MLKSLVEKLFGRKPKVVEPPKKKITVKKKLNVKKAWGTVITKQGEIIRTKECYGYRKAEPLYQIREPAGLGCISTYELHYQYSVCMGKDVFINWVKENVTTATVNPFWQVTVDRMIRVEDVREIINIVESDHEIEFEVEEFA